MTARRKYRRQSLFYLCSFSRPVDAGRLIISRRDIREEGGDYGRHFHLPPIAVDSPRWRARMLFQSCIAIGETLSCRLQADFSGMGASHDGKHYRHIGLRHFIISTGARASPGLPVAVMPRHRFFLID